MLFRPMFLAVPALVLLAACEEGMMSSGAGTTLAPLGSNDINTTATTPDGIADSALNAPGNAGECEQLALIIESADSSEGARQEAVEERARLGC